MGHLRRANQHPPHGNLRQHSVRPRATVEFTGRAGVFDFVREFNLTEQQALEVSDHFPIWAEFSSYEGGQPGRVANRQESLPQR